MISEKELRELMECMGYGPEEIEKTVKTRAALEVVKEKTIEMAGFLRQFLNETLGAALGMIEILDEFACEVVPPKKGKRRRSPRYIGPKNKAPKWVPRPYRVARSSCRKFKKPRWRPFKEVRT